MGVVYLVGAGPGDPGLLTRRAARLLRRADVVVYDALIHPRLLDLAPPSAERVDVGKRGGGRGTAQAEIHRILIDAAARAAVVVRLKGGDPFIFGRGGEEALALAEAGIRFEIVPGVTSGIAAAAYAGIPLTHRGTASAVTFTTGHDDGAAAVATVGTSVGDNANTLVIYMGVRRLAGVVERLIAAGRPPDSPAAIIEWGTYPRQRTITAPLSDLPDRAQAADIQPPALVVVGDVVRLRERLNWFEGRPLFGLRVLVPRTRPQRSRLATKLSMLGAEVIEYPRVESLPARDPGPLRAAIAGIERYGWLLFTSSTAVVRFWDEWRYAGRDARDLAGIRVICCGTATAAAMERRGVHADVRLPTYDAASVTAAVSRTPDFRSRLVLFPSESGAISPIAERLAKAGFPVESVEAVHNVADASDAAVVRDRLIRGEIDAVAFASSGTVHAFVDALGADAGQAIVAAIGPATAQTASSFGLPVHIQPDDSTMDGLVAAIVAGFNAPDRFGSPGDRDLRATGVEPGSETVEAVEEAGCSTALDR